MPAKSHNIPGLKPDCNKPSNTCDGSYIEPVGNQIQSDSKNNKHFTRFDELPGYKHLQKRKQEAVESDTFIPFFLNYKSHNKDTIIINDKEYINYSGYNYLGLSGHPKVSEMAKTAIDTYGTSVSASRIVAGQIPLHSELEQSISEYLGLDDCITFISGYLTNVTTISHLFRKKDLILYDDHVHNSILTGCQLSKAKKINISHNDFQQIDKFLEKNRKKYERVVIIIEGVYSMDGDIPDLNIYISIKNKHDALLMVDEAHSLGVIGKSGGGIAEYFSADRRQIDILMGTLSKSFASSGGFISGDKALIDYLRFLAPGFIFSVGLSPPDTAAALAAFEIFKKEPERVDKLKKNTLEFINFAKKAGINTGLSNDSPIIPVIVGNSLDCMKLSEQLFAHGIYVQPVIYPAVKNNDARLRFFITSMHTEEQIRYSVDILSKELKNIK